MEVGNEKVEGEEERKEGGREGEKVEVICDTFLYR